MDAKRNAPGPRGECIQFAAPKRWNRREGPVHCASHPRTLQALPDSAQSRTFVHFAATFFGFFGRDSIGMTRLVVFFNLRSILIRTRRFFAAVVRGRIGSSPGGSFPQIDTIYPKGPRG